MNRRRRPKHKPAPRRPAKPKGSIPEPDSRSGPAPLPLAAQRRDIDIFDFIESRVQEK